MGFFALLGITVFVAFALLFAFGAIIYMWPLLAMLALNHYFWHVWTGWAMVGFLAVTIFVQFAWIAFLDN